MKGRKIKLPSSGETITIRKSSLAGMIRRGVLPDRLVKAAMGMEELDFKKPERTKPNAIREWLELIANVVCWVVVEPKIVLDNPQPGQLEIDELEDEDQLFIFNEFKRRVDRAGKTLEFFRLDTGGASNRHAGAPLQAKAV